MHLWSVSAQEAQLELKRCGFSMEESESTGEGSNLGAQLSGLLDWQQAAGRHKKGSKAARRARERLQVFQRGHTEHT